ncbi:MAG TPA: hypothetical protein PJ988_18575, partial [Anaerolinea sp.]|nr:hypothetical protein [Anaerolinea sp.]
AGWRTANIGPILAYIQKIDKGTQLPFPRSPANQQSHLVSRQDEQAEYMMVGLRLADEGVSNVEFEQRFGQPLVQAYPRQIEALGRAGLLEWVGEKERRLRLTRRGRLLGNQVFVQFI